MPPGSRNAGSGGEKSVSTRRESRYTSGGVRAYSFEDVTRLFKMSPARLRAWERAELVCPSAIQDSRPAFDFRDLVSIRSVLSLLDDGVPLRRIRTSVEGLRTRVPELERPASALRIWHRGSQRMVARHEGVLLEPNGQTVLDLEAEPEKQPAPVADLAPQAPRVRARAPETAVDWFELGCQKDTDPRTYDQAIVAYRKAVEIDREFPDAFCNLGAVLYNAGRRDEARVSFERTLALYPAHVEANLNYANILEEEERNEAALHHYKAAVRSAPMRADVQLNLALIYEKLGLRRKAREYWRGYLQRAPEGSWSDAARSRLEEE